jgi:hypothetical protein
LHRRRGFLGGGSTGSYYFLELTAEV